MAADFWKGQEVQSLLEEMAKGELGTTASTFDRKSPRQDEPESSLWKTEF